MCTDQHVGRGGLEGEYGAQTCWRMDLGWGQLAERPPTTVVKAPGVTAVQGTTGECAI
jgi:hypothetical protein